MDLAIERLVNERIRYEMSASEWIGGSSVLGALLVLAACTGGDGEAQPSSTQTNETSATTVSSLDSNTSTSTAGPTLDMSQADWLTHGPDGIRTDDGTLIWETRPFPANIARDRQGGFVFTDSSGLWWFQAGERAPERVTGAHEVLAVSEIDDEPAAFTWTTGPNALRLSDASLVDAPPNAPIRVLSEPPWLVWTAANGLTAWIAEPHVELDSEGQPSEIVEPAHLVVAIDDEVLIDVAIAPLDGAWATIHDFDGKSLIVSRGPYEPAMPEESFVLVDLASGEVTEIFEAGGVKATFTGADSDWSGPVVAPESTGSN